MFLVHLMSMSKTRSRFWNQVFWSTWIPLFLSVVRNLPFALPQTSCFITGSLRLYEKVCSLGQGSPRYSPQLAFISELRLEYSPTGFFVFVFVFISGRHQRKFTRIKNSFKLLDQWSDPIFKRAMSMSGPFQKDMVSPPHSCLSFL